MEILLILSTGLINVLCFLIGVKTAQQVNKGEPVEVPSINPMKAYGEKQEKKAYKEEQHKIDAIMSNVECYNGTSQGQRDIPM